MLQTSHDDMLTEIEMRIKNAIPDATITVFPGSDRHFEITVLSQSFADQTLVKQQQRVYMAISGLMEGNDAPVHAIDRLTTSTS